MSVWTVSLEANWNKHTGYDSRSILQSRKYYSQKLHLSFRMYPFIVSHRFSTLMWIDWHGMDENGQNVDNICEAVQHSTAWHSITCRGRGRERENQCPIVCRLGNPTVSAFSCIILQTQTHTHWFKCIHSALLSAPYIIIFQYFLSITFLAQSILFRDSLLFLLGENLLNRKCIHYPISNARWENDRRENLCWFSLMLFCCEDPIPRLWCWRREKKAECYW